MLKQFFPSFDDGERAEAVVLQLKQKVRTIAVDLQFGELSPIRFAT